MGIPTVDMIVIWGKQSSIGLSDNAELGAGSAIILSTRFLTS